ncbi:MAG: class I SAM-dependent rRNA methyltransferase [Candidatus Magasanikbacteria bacterium]|nr:class I SAM-dependent rRNA methyltransferase [Candidatus Magasanikbacteria bacterium]
MINLTVFQKRLGPIRGRHPWVFSGALKHIPEGLASGTPVELIDEQGNFLASGFFNSYSQIAVRLWGFDPPAGGGEEVNEDFFVRRIERAYEIRKKFVASKQTDSYRLVYGENDLLPGLIVDKYADYLSVQFHNPGIEFWKKDIVGALVKTLKPKGIYERSDVRDRKRAVILSETKNPLHSDLRDPSATPQDDNKATGLLYGKVPERVIIKENGYKFYVDIIGGQKTGFFLDQRDKRLALAKYSEDKSVLNCFSYTGGFSVYALGAGAKKVVSVDASESALTLAEENIKLNKLPASKCEFILADVKEYLSDLASQTTPNPSFAKEGERTLASAEERVGGEISSSLFDVIILDPPAFVKDRHKVKEGLQGYRKINELALNILPAGGILVTASCSAHVTLTDFRFMLSEAAARASRTVQILETYTHGIDHPELVAFTEGEYLKCLFCIVN